MSLLRQTPISLRQTPTLLRQQGAALVLLLVALLATSCTIWRAPTSASWKSSTQMEDYERLMWKAVQEGDWKQVESHMAETFVGVDGDAVRDRAATLDRLRQIKLTGYSLGEFDSKPNGADMVVSYTAVLHGTLGGQPLPAGPLRILTVWQTAKGGWIQVAQSTLPQRALASPPGPSGQP